MTPALILALMLACDCPVEDTLRPEGLLLVSDSGNGRVLFADHGADVRVGEVCLSELFPDDCAQPDDGSWVCLVFGVQREDDSDTLRIAYASSTIEQEGFPGGVVAVTPGHPPTVEWQVDRLYYPDDPDLDLSCQDPETDEPLCRLNMPHMSDWMPDGETLVVADTLNNRVIWLDPGAGGERARVLRDLDQDHASLDAAWWPNAVQVLEHEDAVLLLVTYKGSDPGVTGASNLGRILLWDVSDLDAPARLWAWPEEGYLAAVHGGRVVEGPDGAMLLYGHAWGASESSEEGLHGSVGVASITLPEPPVYVADALVEGQPLGFVRDADLVRTTAGDWELFVTDSGCENTVSNCGLPGRLSELAWSPPEARGASGAWSADHAEQVFVDMPEEREGYIGGLSFPFETRLFAPDDAPAAWWDLGGCE